MDIGIYVSILTNIQTFGFKDHNAGKDALYVIHNYYISSDKYCVKTINGLYNESLLQMLAQLIYELLRKTFHTLANSLIVEFLTRQHWYWNQILYISQILTFISHKH